MAAQNQHSLTVLAAILANNQLPLCTFSITEGLTWWAFTPVKMHPLQDYGLKVGLGGGGGAGVCPGVSLYLKLNGVHDGIYPAVYMIYVQKVCGERG